MTSVSLHVAVVCARGAPRDKGYITVASIGIIHISACECVPICTVVRFAPSIWLGSTASLMELSASSPTAIEVYQEISSGYNIATRWACQNTNSRSAEKIPPICWFNNKVSNSTWILWLSTTRKFIRAHWLPVLRWNKKTLFNFYGLLIATVHIEAALQINSTSSRPM